MAAVAVHIAPMASQIRALGVFPMVKFRIVTKYAAAAAIKYQMVDCILALLFIYCYINILSKMVGSFV